MATNLYYPPTQNGLQKTLGAGLDTGITASATLNNTTGVPNKPGVIVVNRIDSDGTELSSSVREWISYTGTSGSTITTLTRGLGGSTDQDHAVGSVVEFIFDITVLQAILDKLDGTDTTALEDTNGNEMLETTTTASAVNNLLIKNAATGNNPVIAANGEADTGITFENDQGEEILILDANATAVNEVTIDNAATGNNPVISATGDDTNIGLELTPKGTGVVDAKVGLKVAGSTVSVNDILDEDDMSSDSATALATQQSIKAYVDTTAVSKTTLPYWDELTGGSVGVNSTTYSDVCSVTISAASMPGAGKIQIVAHYTLSGATAGDRGRFRIRVDNTTVISEADQEISVANDFHTGCITGYTTTAGSSDITIDLELQRSSGSGTVTANNNLCALQVTYFED